MSSQPRGRPRTDPHIRFNAEVSYWNLAMQSGSLALPCADNKKAIHLMHRMNMARAAVRDTQPGRFLPWDEYVVRLNGASIIILPKEDLVDVTQITQADGSPISPEMWKRAAEQPIGAPEPSAQFTASLATPKPASTPTFRGHSGVFPKMPPPPETFDPNAPLDLDKE
jgi:hypothetical protein